ncbi:flagellar motor protein MotB [Sulfitobacter sp. R18_1]|uniref:flagellar motor protein MotB n=1 Tax=Sulfitobacter sp. R18_1 TaxID=2821104 RepID=UPI001ADA20DA|nr:flagellar motor protein MotB [Sulfitobacter sp. R18_1]MBO9428404.1 OmpA family protein [Sulfitobacter sp. R18_1]
MSDKQRPIIIKKVIEEGGHGHHGGAWKVAYADFVTAMMAFFLLLWILSSVQEEQLEGLADYFTPTMSEQNGAGGDGLLDGTTVGEPGTLSSSNSPMSTVALPQFGQQDPMDVRQTGEPEVITEYIEVEADKMQGELEQAMKAKDEQSFANLEEQIVQAMNSVPDLKPLIPNVIFDKTEEGLRIQIIDQEGQSMFSSGSAVVEGRTKQLMKLVGGAVAQLPNDVILSGHTDAVPFANENAETGYGNWELSADRANATRRIFTTSGVEMNRIHRVAGLADTDPFDTENPRAASNRRISVVLKYAEAPNAEEIQDAMKRAGDPEGPHDAHNTPTKSLQDDHSVTTVTPQVDHSEGPAKRERKNTISIDELRDMGP